jgi:predicted nucleic acid-binding protein
MQVRIATLTMTCASPTTAAESEHPQCLRSQQFASSTWYSQEVQRTTNRNKIHKEQELYQRDPNDDVLYRCAMASNAATPVMYRVRFLLCRVMENKLCGGHRESKNAMVAKTFDI